MNVLLDTLFVIYLADDRIEQIPRQHQGVIFNESSNVFVSAASLWEVAIMSLTGKLPVRTAVEKWPGILESVGAVILPIDVAHVFKPVEPAPETRDPFDRLLLGVCAAESLKLVTLDRVLAQHPLAWRT